MPRRVISQVAAPCKALRFFISRISSFALLDKQNSYHHVILDVREHEKLNHLSCKLFRQLLQPSGSCVISYSTDLSHVLHVTWFFVVVFRSVVFVSSIPQLWRSSCNFVVVWQWNVHRRCYIRVAVRVNFVFWHQTLQQPAIWLEIAWQFTTRSSPAAERPRDATCHYIFHKVTRVHSKWHPWVGRV